MSERKMTCIAIDDEPFALKLISDDIQKVPFLDLRGTYSSPMEGEAYSIRSFFEGGK
jgi:hypothetical protein